MPKTAPTKTRKKVTKAATPKRVRKTAPVSQPVEVSEIILPVVRTTEYMHWTIFAVVSIAVAGLLLYAGRPDRYTSNAATAPSPVSRSASTDKDAPAYVPSHTSKPTPHGVIGIVTDISAHSLTIRSLAPTNDGQTLDTIYIATINDTTTFVYHPLTATSDAKKKVFGTQPGTFASIKKGMYASATTTANIATQTTFDASEINYSETSPLE